MGKKRPKLHRWPRAKRSRSRPIVFILEDSGLRANDVKDAKLPMQIDVNNLRWRRPLSYSLCQFLASGILFLLAAAACGEEARQGQPPTNGKSEAGVRNVIIMIGDGMGPQQVGLLTQYAKLAANST